MKNQEYVYSPRLVTLMGVNAALDYAAICEYYDVEPFTLEVGIGNLISAVVSFGLALVLSAFAQRAATAWVGGRVVSSYALRVLCAALSLGVAGFRVAFEGASAGVGIAGSSSGISPSSALFAVMLFLMLAGEAVIAYHDRISAYEREADVLGATLERIDIDLESIERQVESAAREANERMLEAVSLVNAADEAILEEALRHAGEMQSAFVGYAAEAEKARSEHGPQLAERVKGLLIGAGTPEGHRRKAGQWQVSTSESNAA